jgi:hypothetical protein
MPTSGMLVAKRVLSLINRAEELQCSERALCLVSFNAWKGVGLTEKTVLLGDNLKHPNEFA